MMVEGGINQQPAKTWLAQIRAGSVAYMVETISRPSFRLTEANFTAGQMELYEEVIEIQSRVSQAG